MEILNREESFLAFGWIPVLITPTRRYATFVIKGSFRLSNGSPAVPFEKKPVGLLGDALHDDDPKLGLRSTTDFAPFKKQGEFLLSGSARAERPVTRLDVGVRVGPLTKRLLVLGNRRWEPRIVGRPGKSDPKPFVTMPLRYDLAYGGPDSRTNPLGQGYKTPLLPNIEIPEKQARGSRDKIDPAGFGPLDPGWEPRKKLTGTYNKKWVKERSPYLPTDFDLGYFNAAPPDQRFSGYVNGDEPVELTNLVEGFPSFTFTLPGIRARCFLQESARESGKGSSFRSLPLNLDTVFIDADALVLTLTWRALAEVGSFKLKEVERAFVLAEPLDEPDHDNSHYRALMTDFIAAEEAQTDFELSNPDLGPGLEATKVEFAQMEEEMDALSKSAEQEDASVLDRAKEAGADPEALEAEQKKAGTTPAIPPPAPEVAEEHPEKMKALEEEEASAAAADETMAAMDAETDALDRAGEGGLTRADVESRIQDAAPLAGEDLSGLDLSGLDFSRLDMSEARLVGTDLSGCKMIDTVLANADCSSAKMKEADLSGADLSGVDCSRATLEGAVFRGTTIGGIELVDLDLTGADFTEARGASADFSGSKLGKALFVQADLPLADFDRCLIEEADFSGACLDHAELTRVKASGIVMEDARLTGLRSGGEADLRGGNFRGVQAADSIWQTCLLDAADFSGAELSRAQFDEAVAPRSRFDRSILVKASFNDAVLVESSLRFANLLRASLERTDMRMSSFRGANLYEAGLFESTREDTDFEDANLKQTLLA